ncbi:MAG: RcnB family protein [Pseudomonadota bacterium]
MKITLLTAAAAMALVSAFASVPASAEQNNYRSHQEQGQTARDGDRDHQGQDRADRNDGDHQGQDQADRNHGDQRQYGDMRRRHHGRSWRDSRSDARWDEQQHNGYYQNSRWHYGPPPANRYGTRGFALGYHPWARGQRLGYYNGRYAEVDYRSHGLRRPSRGYHWVRDDNSGDFLLAAIATGIITSVILDQGR